MNCTGSKVMKKVLVTSVVCVGAALLSARPAQAGLKPEGQFYTNSLGMKFVRIEPGTFTMGVGSTPLPVELTNHRGTQAEGDFDERPNHDVVITRPFYMGVCEVTNKQYELFEPEHKQLRGKDNGLSEADDEAVINVNRTCLTVFPRRPNGNMPAGRVRRRTILPGIFCPKSSTRTPE